MNSLTATCEISGSVKEREEKEERKKETTLKATCETRGSVREGEEEEEQKKRKNKATTPLIHSKPLHVIMRRVAKDGLK